MGKWVVDGSLTFSVHFLGLLYSQKRFQNNQKGFVTFDEASGYMVGLLCVFSAFDCRAGMFPSSPTHLWGISSVAGGLGKRQSLVKEAVR